MGTNCKLFYPEELKSIDNIISYLLTLDNIKDINGKKYKRQQLQSTIQSILTTKGNEHLFDALKAGMIKIENKLPKDNQTKQYLDEIINNFKKLAWEENTTINIWENEITKGDHKIMPELSNLAERPFYIQLFENEDPIYFRNVEQAFRYLQYRIVAELANPSGNRFLLGDISTLGDIENLDINKIQNNLNTLSTTLMTYGQFLGFQNKNPLPKGFEELFNNSEGEFVNSLAAKFMKILIKESFLQNKKAAQTLVDTKESPFLHYNPHPGSKSFNEKNIWREVLPIIMGEVRQEIKNESTVYIAESGYVVKSEKKVDTVQVDENLLTAANKEGEKARVNFAFLEEKTGVIDIINTGTTFRFQYISDPDLPNVVTMIDYDYKSKTWKISKIPRNKTTATQEELERIDFFNKNNKQTQEEISTIVSNYANPLIISLIEENHSKALLSDFNIPTLLGPGKTNIENGLQPASIQKKNKLNLATVFSSNYASLEEIEASELALNPQERMDIVAYIAEQFSTILEEDFDTEREKIQELLNKMEHLSIDERISVLKRQDLTKLQYLAEVSPSSIFKQIENAINNYATCTIEEIMELETIEEVRDSEWENATEEEIMAEARRRAEIRYRLFSTVANKKLFKALVENACFTIQLNENISLNVGEDTITENLIEDDANNENGENYRTSEDDVQKKEESHKEGWMEDFRNLASHESLSKDVKSFLRTIYMRDRNGNVILTSLGFPKFLNSEYVHSVLMDKLQNITKPEDLLPALKKLIPKYSWMEEVVERLEIQEEDKGKPWEAEKEMRLAALYQDFRKDFTSYAAQRTTMKANGELSTKTVIINKPEGTYYLLDQWRNNYEHGIQLIGKDTVYNELGVIDKVKAKKYYKQLEQWWNKYIIDIGQELNSKILSEASENEDMVSELLYLLNAIGIDVDFNNLQLAMQEVPMDLLTEDGETTSEKEGHGNYKDKIDTLDIENFPLFKIVGSLQSIYSGMSASSQGSTTDIDGKTQAIDAINKWGKEFNNIAFSIGAVIEEAIESSVAETINGKTKSYYSHTVPNFMGTLIKELKNKRNSEHEFLKYINDNFKTDWFWNENTQMFRLDWLNKLVFGDYTSEEIQVDWENCTYITDLSAKMGNGLLNPSYYRNLLDHKVVLHSNKVDYTKWDNMEYLQVMYNEFNSPGATLHSASEEKYGEMSTTWYAIPILSDSPSAEFIKFVKYNGNDFKDRIANRLVDLVTQEYKRILLVENRDFLRNNKDFHVTDYNNSSEEVVPRTESIDNYDIVRNEKGEIKKKGGAEFKFLPELNDLMILRNGKKMSFIEALKDKVLNKDTDIEEFITNAVHEVMNEKFEKAYQEMCKNGAYTVMDTDKDYAPLKYFEGSYHIKTALVNLTERLTEVRKILGKEWDSKWDTIFDLIEKGIKNETYYVNESKVNTLLSEVISTILNKQETIDKLLNSNNIDFLESEDSARKTIDQQLKDVLKLNSYFREKMEKFFWNHAHATSQIIQLTTTDLAFYKNMEDFQKRYKEVHSPALRLYTKATFQGEKVGKDFEKTLILKDINIKSTMYDSLKEALDYKIKKGDITKTDAKNILRQFENVNVADAQALRSLPSYRAVMVMAGKWNQNYESAYKRIISGTWEMRDLNVLLQTIKPFVFTHRKATTSNILTDEYNKITSVIKDKKGIIIEQLMYDTKEEYNADQKNREALEKKHNAKFETVLNTQEEILDLPTQHKNSEFLLMAIYSTIANSMGKSTVLKTLNQFMINNDIDVVQFESTTKVGGMCKIDISDEAIAKEMKTSNLTKEEAINTILYRETKITAENPNGDTNVVQLVNYNDWGIQTATPEHHMDKMQLLGTQIRKLITADMDDNCIINATEILGDIYRLPNSTVLPFLNKTVAEIKQQGGFTKKDLIDYYNAVHTENILQSFKEIHEKFSDPLEVEKLLQEQIRSSNRYGSELAKACRFNKETGTFNLPLFDPIQSERIQQLLNSIIKSRVTKQKIKGGSLIQVSNFGLTDELSVVFKDSNNKIYSFEDFYKKNKRKFKDNKEEAKKAFMQEVKDKDLAVAYFECYMPAYSASMFEGLIDPNTGLLKVQDLDEDLRKVIGYRVPTEDKYSMAPLYIKGFLPQQNGSAIMLPSDITTIAGSDFDVDKMYIMLPEFNTIRYDKAKAYQDYKAERRVTEKMSMLLSHFKNGDNLAESVFEKDQSFKNWYREHKDDKDENDKFKYKLDKPKYKKIKYDHTKLPQNQSKNPTTATAMRNNFIIDMMWGVLTNTDTTNKILNPGGFESLKKTARIIDILDSIDYDTLKTIQDRENKNSKNKKEIHELLEEKSIKELDAILEQYKTQKDPLSFMTQLYFHKQNMTGGQLIGMYANHNANHALMQQTELILKDEKGFIINGKKLLKMNQIKNGQGQFISRNVAEFLAASVDNVKDPVLAYLQQNAFTADATMVLAKLGYTHLEIGLIMNQPIVKDIIKNYMQGKSQGKSKKAAIEEVIAKYAHNNQIIEDTLQTKFFEKNKNFTTKKLVDNIITSKVKADTIKFGELSEDDPDFAYYKSQVDIGYLFRRIVNIGEDLSTLITTTRADTSNGAAGPTIADTVDKILKVSSLEEKVGNGTFSFNNVPVLDNSITFEGNWDEYRKRILESKLPMIQAFYSCGILETANTIGKFFPFLNRNFINVIQDIQEFTKWDKLDVKTMNNIYNDLMVYIMSKTPFFGTEEMIDENGKKIIWTAEQKRSYFINEFPQHFEALLEENPDIAEMEFISRLKVLKPYGKRKTHMLIFKNVGHLTPELKDKYTQEWTSLLYSQNPTARILALNLFRYSYYRNGFAFGPNSFIHLASVLLRKRIPGYVDNLYKILEDEDNYSEFVQQYMRNHLNNSELVATIPEGTLKEAFLKPVNKIINGEQTTVTEIKDDPSDIVMLSYNSKLSYKEAKFLKSVETTKDNVRQYIFMPYISRTYNGTKYFYRLSSQEGETAIYVPIKTLGEQYQFIEYEYGKEASEINSVIKDQRIDLLGKYNITEEELSYTPSLEGAKMSLMTSSEMSEDFSDPYIDSLTIDDYLGQPVNEYYDDNNYDDYQNHQTESLENKNIEKNTITEDLSDDLSDLFQLDSDAIDTSLFDEYNSNNNLDDLNNKIC